jgi:hypothetical protein
VPGDSGRNSVNLGEQKSILAQIISEETDPERKTALEFSLELSKGIGFCELCLSLCFDYKGDDNDRPAIRINDNGRSDTASGGNQD